jgi:hypothetical protein
MATTSVIVEIFIIGFFASIWIFLFCLRFSLLDEESLRQLAGRFEPSTQLLIASALFYHLGILMNMISYRVTRYLAPDEYRNKLIKNIVYENIKAKVQQDGSEEVGKSFTLGLSFVRLTRAGIVNFFLISVGLLLERNKFKISWLVPLAISILSFLAWRGAYRAYYKRVAYAYRVLTGAEVNEEIALQKIGPFYELRTLLRKLKDVKAKKKPEQLSSDSPSAVVK